MRGHFRWRCLLETLAQLLSYLLVMLILWEDAADLVFLMLRKPTGSSAVAPNAIGEIILDLQRSGATSTPWINDLSRQILGN